MRFDTLESGIYDGLKTRYRIIYGVSERGFPRDLFDFFILASNLTVGEVGRQLGL